MGRGSSFDGRAGSFPSAVSRVLEMKYAAAAFAPRGVAQLDVKNPGNVFVAAAKMKIYSRFFRFVFGRAWVPLGESPAHMYRRQTAMTWRAKVHGPRCCC